MRFVIKSIAYDIQRATSFVKVTGTMVFLLTVEDGTLKGKKSYRVTETVCVSRITTNLMSL